MASVADLVESPAVESLASATALADGELMAREGAVTLTIFTPLTVAASVRAAPPGRTTLDATGCVLRRSCSCAPGRVGSFRAHLVATARVAWERAPARR